MKKQFSINMFVVMARVSALLILFLTATLAGVNQQPPPNFILIIADDLAWDDVGAYGHKTVRTPNLDRLAGEGMRFDRGFVTASSCSPSRSSIITGRYPHNTDAEQLHWPLPPEQTTFVERLKAAGYWTAAAGKWHLGEAIKSRFDVVREADPAGFLLRSNKAAGSGAAVMRASRQSGAEDWVETLRERPQDKPFFLWLAALDPHRDYEENIIPQPHRPEDTIIPPYLPDVPMVRKDFALYYDEITRLDAYVGNVLAELDRQGARQNTFILFISDNGRAFPRAKTTLYDSGIKTPWIVRWPIRVKAGTTSASLVSTIDIAPTILGLANLEVAPSFQGKSFLPVLENPKTTTREFIHAERNWHDYEDRARAVRSAKYKYIRNYYIDLPSTPPADAVRSLSFRAMRGLRDAGKLTSAQMIPFNKPRPAEELYDTEVDPHELNNLANNANHARALKTLQQELSRWEKATSDIVPARRTPDEFNRETGEPLPNRQRPRPSKEKLFDSKL